MLTNDQAFVFDQVMKELGFGKSDEPKFFLKNFDYITIGGLAGTGKTFLISILRKEIYNKCNYLKVAFVTFTGKASSVLKTKLKEQDAIYSEDFVGTIHSLIYKPEIKYDAKLKMPVLQKWIKKEFIDYDLIFVDEASMVNSSIWTDLLNYGIPIIAVGDHGQLPPIEGAFSLMTKPNYILKEIKRQALDNPIIQLSQEIRQGKMLDFEDGYYNNSKKIIKYHWNSEDCKNFFKSLDFLSNEVICLCGLNQTRVFVNQMIRDKHGFIKPEPYPGERVIFLKNNYETKIMNGMLGTTLFFMYETPEIYNMSIIIDDYDNIYSGLIHKECYGKVKYPNMYDTLKESKYKKIIKKSKFGSIDLADWGYCISVHKSQGSEFNKVICFVESLKQDPEYMKRWLYTAVTRAKDKLFLIV